MHSCPPACAVVDFDGEDAKEEEEAGHAEAHLVDCRVSDQSFTVLSRIQLLAEVAVEWDLIDKNHEHNTLQSAHYGVEYKHDCSCLSGTEDPEKRTQQHLFWASRLWRSRKRGRQQQQPLFLSA